jgi:hypothetical protein
MLRTSTTRLIVRAVVRGMPSKSAQSPIVKMASIFDYDLTRHETKSFAPAIPYKNQQTANKEQIAIYLIHYPHAERHFIYWGDQKRFSPEIRARTLVGNCP